MVYITRVMHLGLRVIKFYVRCREHMFLVLDYHWGSGTNCTYSVCERWADDFMSGIYGCECRWNASDNYEYSGSQPTGIFMHLATIQVTISLWDWLMEAMLTPVHQPTVVFSTPDVVDGMRHSAHLVLCNGQLSSGKSRCLLSCF